MAKSRRKRSKNAYGSWLKRKRAKGRMGHKVSCLIRKGTSNKLHPNMMSSFKTHREIHLMSNLERDWFICFDRSPDIIDIRDQFNIE